MDKDIKSLRKQAERGNADAQVKLGECYAKGQGIPKDSAEAARWYRKAAEQGDARAQERLGLCYSNGEGVPQDFFEAVRWYRKAAEQGLALAQSRLGQGYYDGEGVPQDYVEAVQWLRKASEQNSSDGGVFFNIQAAQVRLGHCYYNGRGVLQDYAEAVRWYRQAAEKKNIQVELGNKFVALEDSGDLEAQNRLGICYYNGLGVPQNYTEAVQWFRKAAEEGLADAQYYLGKCYYDGQGVSQDYNEAIVWYRKAAENGNTDAQVSLEKEILCKKCGERLEKDWTICPACNSKVFKGEKQEVCVKCGTVLKPNWMSCPKCQAPIAGNKKPKYVLKAQQHGDCPDCGKRLKGGDCPEGIKNWCEQCGYVEIYPRNSAIDLANTPGLFFFNLHTNCPKCQSKLEKSYILNPDDYYHFERLCPECGYLEFTDIQKVGVETVFKTLLD